MSKLYGSAKQVSWALTIQRQMIETAENLKKTLEKNKSKNFDIYNDLKEGLKLTLKLIKNEKSANFFIEQRSSDFVISNTCDYALERYNERNNTNIHFLKRAVGSNFSNYPSEIRELFY